MQLPVSATQLVSLRGELGWEHQYGELDRATSLKFAGSERVFAVNSVPVSRPFPTELVIWPTGIASI